MARIHQLLHLWLHHQHKPYISFRSIVNTYKTSKVWSNDSKHVRKSKSFQLGSHSMLDICRSRKGTLSQGSITSVCRNWRHFADSRDFYKLLYVIFSFLLHCCSSMIYRPAPDIEEFIHGCSFWLLIMIYFLHWILFSSWCHFTIKIQDLI